MSDFLERNQKPSDKKRTKIIDIFIQKAGDQLDAAVAIAEEVHAEGKSFERSLADALQVLKIK